MEKKSIVILFAGPAGSSKTPIANFLSPMLNLPVINNDAIRSEVIADLGVFDEKEFRKRVDERIKYMLESNLSCIYDASIDRAFREERKMIELLKEHYNFFIISLDFSKELLNKVYNSKGCDTSVLDKYIKDHEEFLKHHSDEVNLSLKDEDFPDRLKISLEAAKNWMKDINK